MLWIHNLETESWSEGQGGSMANGQSDRKVVLVKGDSSKGYEQAIFIMRGDNKRATVTDFVREADALSAKAGFCGSGAAIKQAKPPTRIDRAAYAKAEGLPLPVTDKKANAKKAKRRGRRFDMRLNVALVIVGLAIIWLIAFSVI